MRGPGVSIYILCLSSCLYLINVKADEPDRSAFIYGNSKFAIDNGLTTDR